MKQKKESFLENLNKRHISAYKHLYEDYYKALVVYAMDLVSQKEIAEDIVQDLFVSIWEKEMVFISLAAFKSFLYRSVRNASLNHIKHIDVEEKYVLSLQQNNEPEFDLEVEEEEIYRLLFSTIEKLPPRCHEIFEMHLKGKKNDEIAETLNISLETVKTQKKRAIKFIRENISPFYFLLILPDIL